jgi:ribosomal protein S18 acetylase RimI-like enzyme
MTDVRLDPMTDEEFTAYYHDAVVAYAAAHLDPGSLPVGEVGTVDADDHTGLLPEGLATSGHHLFTARDGDRRVGVVWFAERAHGTGRAAYIYDIRTEPLLRGDGYGEAIMRAVEGRVAADGIEAIRLHVFGDNSAARSLYRKLGYVETDVTMAKQLG